MTAVPVLANRDWRERAACLNYPLDLFFPEGSSGSPAVAAQVAEATAVCAGCPVRAQCLDWALSNGERFGVWGGQAEGQRTARGSALTSGAPSLCQSGRHPRAIGEGRCAECKRENNVKRGKARPRDHARVYAMRVGRALERKGLAA